MRASKLIVEGVFWFIILVVVLDKLLPLIIASYTRGHLITAIILAIVARVLIKITN